MKINFTPFLLATSIVFADMIELKTGERVEGAFQQATQAGVVIEVGGQSITMPLANVRAIYLGMAPTAPMAETRASLALESLDALRALESVTKSGVNYRDYSSRVLDAKVIVDRYLRSAKDDAEVQAAMSLAMRYYELVSQCWYAWLTKSEGNLVVMDIAKSMVEEDRLAGGCLAVKQLLAKEPTRRAPLPAVNAVYGIGSAPTLIWPCASAKIAEAERLLKPQAQPAQQPVPSPPAPPVVPVPSQKQEDPSVITITPRR